MRRRNRPSGGRPKVDAPLAVAEQHLSSLGQLWRLAIATYRDAREDRIVGLGAEVAFFALLSLPPGLLAVLGAMGLIADWLGPQATARIQSTVLDTAATFLTPMTVEQLIAPTVESVLERGRADVASIGLLVSIYTASRATRVLTDATVIAYDLPDPRSIVKRRLVAVGITVGGMVALAVVLPAFVGGPRLGGAIARPLGLEATFGVVWRSAYWPSVVIVGVALLTTYYHLVVPWWTPWRRDLPGAVAALVLWLSGAAALRVYVAWTISSDSTYGPLAAPVVVLLWLYVTAMALLVGAELNAEIEKLWPSGVSRDAARRQAELRPGADDVPAVE